MESKLKIAVVILVVALLTVSIAYAVHYLTLNTSGTVNAPASLSASPQTWSWGAINQGASTSQLVTLTNNGDQTTGALQFTASPGVGTLSTNATNYVLAAGESVTVNFTLTVSGSASPGSFSFGITVED